MSVIVGWNPQVGRFGSIIRKLRTGVHLSQNDLAIRVGVSPRQVATWEKLDTPDLYGRNYIKLAEALGVSSEVLDEEWSRVRKEDEPLVVTVGGETLSTLEQVQREKGFETLDATAEYVIREVKKSGLHESDDLPASPAPPPGENGGQGDLAAKQFTKPQPPPISHQPEAQRRMGIPLVSQVPGGPPIDFAAELYSNKYLPEAIYPYYDQFPVAFVAVGDSMMPIIGEGDLVIALRSAPEPIVPNTIVIAQIDDEGITVKWCDKCTDKEVILRPENTRRGKAITYERSRVKQILPVVFYGHYAYRDRLPPYKFAKGEKK